MGQGRVSDDGSVIETVEGGIRNSSWHFFAPPPAELISNDPYDLRAICLRKCLQTHTFTSDVELHSGAVIETHDLATYQSLGVTRGITLAYDSLRADPRPIIHFGYDDVDPNALAPGFSDKLRLLAELTVHGDGFDYQVPGFAGGQYGLDGGEHFWSLPNQAGRVDAALQADLHSFTSGKYDYSLNSGIRLFVRDRLQGTSTLTSGEIIHVNSIDSAFGSGWGLSGLQELVENSDGSVLLIDGNGGELLFNVPEVDGQPYFSPTGEHSILERTSDGTFRRTLKDREVYQFNAHNQLSSVTDRNGNQTTYEYDAGDRLIKVIDPVGLATTFRYTNDRISSITDPANRVTQLVYDEFGNLERIIDPDDSVRTFEYDSDHHLVAEVNQRGHREEAFYDFAGRATKALRKDGSTVQVAPVQVQGLYRPDATINPLVSPVAHQLDDPVGNFVDGNGNIESILLDQAANSHLLRHPNGSYFATRMAATSPPEWQLLRHPNGSYFAT